jgi:8-oxo-dGTP pyrophosphatase MutT (NUDIX family)
MATPQLADRDEIWPVESSTDLHRDDWVVALRSDAIRRPDQPEGETFDRLVLEHPGAVVVLALDEENRALCLRQYRHPARRRFVELPAGLLDEPGERPEDVAKRELREEAGLEAGHWTYLTSVYSSPGISAEVQHFYLARGLRHVDRGDFVARHEEAEMETFWVPFAELVSAVQDGRVSDGPLVIAVLIAQARGKATGGRAER